MPKINKKKILVGIATNGTGGVDSYIVSFVRAAFAEGVFCDVLSSNPSEDLKKKLSKYNSELIKIANLHNKSAISSKIHELCSKGTGTKYISAYMNISTDIMYPYIKACYDEKIPNIVVHAHAHYNSQPNFIKTKIFDFAHYYYRKKLMKLPVKIAACSKDSAEWIGGKKVTLQENWVFVPNPIDTDACRFDENSRNKKRAELSSELNTNLTNTTIIGTATAFMPYKNPLYLFDVFAEYLKLNDNSFLVFAGDGPMRSEAEQYAAKILPKSKYKLLGMRKDIAELLQAYDAFVLPSKNEGLPLCILEAQAADLPCLMATSITKESVVLQNNVARVPLSQGPKAWAEKLHFLIKGHPSRTSEAAKLVSRAGFNLNSPLKVLPYLTGNDANDK